MDFEYLATPQDVETEATPGAADIRAMGISTVTGVDYETAKDDFEQNGNDSLLLNSYKEKEMEANRQGLQENIHLIIQDEDLTEDEKIQVYNGELSAIPDINTGMDNQFKDSEIGATEYDKAQIQSDTATVDFFKELDERVGRTDTHSAKELSDVIMAEANRIYPDAKVENIRDMSWHMFNTTANALRGAAMAAFPTMGFELVSLHNELFPEESLDLTDYVFIGEITDKLKEKIASLENTEEKIAFMKRSRDILIKKGTFMTGADPHAPLFHMLDIAEDEISGEKSDFTYWVNNVAGVMEAMSITAILLGGATAALGLTAGAGILATGLIIAGTAKIGKKMIPYFRPNTPIESLNASNPIAMSKAGKELSENPDKMKAVGLTANEVINQYIFKGDLHVPQKFFDYMQDTSAKLKEIDSYVSENTWLVPLDDVDKAGEILKTMLEKNFMHLHNVDTTIETASESLKRNEGLSFRWNGYVGSSAETGFRTLEEAMSHAASMKNAEDVEGTKYFFRNNNGELKEVTDFTEINKDGNFLYSIGGEVKTPDLLSTSKKIKFKLEDIHKGWMYHEIQESYRDVNALFTKQIAATINTLHHRSAGVAGEMREIFKPFMSMGVKDQGAVVAALDKRMKEAKPITMDWILNEATLSPRQQYGMIAYKSSIDGLHFLANSRYRRKLEVDNYQWVNIPEKVNALGKKIDSVDNIELTDGARTYYDPYSGAVKSITKDDLDILYAHGGSLVELRSHKRTSDGLTESKYVIAPPTPEGETYFKALPRQVLNYNPLYFRPQLHQNNIYITETVSVMRDGKKHTYDRAIAGADSWAEAQRTIKNLEAELPEGSKTEYTSRYAKELEPSDVEEAVDQIREKQNELFFSKRTAPTEGLNGYSSVRDNVEAVITGFDVLSNKLMKGDVVQQMKLRFMNTFGEELGLQGKYPTRVGQLGKNNQAKIMWRAIDNVSAQNNGKLNDAWRGLMLETARKLGDIENQNVFLGQSQKDFIKLAEVSPGQVMRSIAFNLAIRGAPARQALLQSQQFLTMLPLAGSPVRAAKSVGQTFEVLMELTGEWSGMLKRSPETRQLVYELRKSGFLATLNQHAHLDLIAGIGVNARKGLIESTRESVHAISQAPFTVGGTGFFAGEGFNRIGSWLIAREGHFNKTGKYPKTRREWDSVNADAEAITLSMHKNNRYIWQKGSFKTLTQFMGIQFKSVGAVTVSKQFTGMEKLKLATWQTLMYGSQAFGISPHLDDILSYADISLTEDERTIALGGMVDLTAMKMLGDHMRISEAISASGGPIQTLHNIYKALMGKQGKTLLDVIPAVSISSRLFDAYENTNHIWDMSIHSDVPFVDMKQEPMAMLKEFNAKMRPIADIMSGFNNSTKAKIYEKYGDMHTNAGMRMGIDMSDKSVAMMKYLGLHSQKEADFYSLKQRKGFTSVEDGAEEHANDIKELVKLQRTYILKYKEQTNFNPDKSKRYKKEMVDSMFSLNKVINEIYGDNSKFIRQEVDKKLKEDNFKNTYNVLLDAIYSDLAEGVENSQDTKRAVNWAISKSHTTDVVTRDKLQKLYTKFRE